MSSSPLTAEIVPTMDRSSRFGCRIAPMPAPVDPALVDDFSSIPVACVSDVMMRLAAGGADLRPMGTADLCGTAVTVRVPPGDNLMVHKAIDLARAGDVIVVDAGGDLTNAIIGERMVTAAMAKGIAGFVIYGAVRDVAHLRTCGFPVFAAGVTHRGPYKNGPGELNFPIAVNGLVLRPATSSSVTMTVWSRFRFRTRPPSLGPLARRPITNGTRRPRRATRAGSTRRCASWAAKVSSGRPAAKEQAAAPSVDNA